MPSYIVPPQFTSTRQSQSAYWADADEAYIAHQQSLGRDTSEYRPEIREACAERVRAARVRSGQQKRIRTEWSGFGSQRMPWYERLLARLRGWDT